MRTRYVFIGAFVSLAPLGLQSCSSDPTPFTAVHGAGEGGLPAGKGGSGASSGKGGSGASSGKGGSGGNAGSAVSTGGGAGDAQGGNGEGGEAGGAFGVGGSSAGAGHGGSGLTSGSGGEPASGGEAGDGGAPASGGAPVSGGAAGAGGAGADAGAGQGGGDGGGDVGTGGRDTPEQPKGCGYECSVDQDCDSPGILKYVCAEKTKRCAAPELTCSGHRDCVAFASSWTVACEKDDDCLSTADVCVDAGGYGRCAREFGQSLPCSLPDQVSVTRTRFGTLEDVQVCGRTNGRCGDGACFLGCTGPSDCGKGDGDGCDAESGRCTCIDDNECTSGAISHCNTRTQRCDECASDFDCFLDPSRDECVQGRCGCSSADVCSNVIFPAATPVCE